MAVAQVRLNQVATSMAGFRRCPAGALRGGGRAVASWLAGGGFHVHYRGGFIARYLVRVIRPAGLIRAV